MAKITPQTKDFSKWYLEVIKEADLAEYSQVKGCMVIKPYGYAIWENIQRELDRRIKEAGVKNVYFPLFIPESFLRKEKEHVKGFAPECAVVTHGGGRKLSEPLVIRPTSETVMYATFANWIKSYRDLPLLINQWCNVVRWEMRTRLFLRTTEFLWQEGHTVHATKEEADAEANRALKMYADFDREFLALPVLTGLKSEKEKFAGALYTLSTEALAKDGKAIQAGTSHNLGQGFARAFGIQFLDEKGELRFPWQTSWGLSTRIIGTIVIVHGDDRGLKLPPQVAPIQLVIVPIWKNKEEKAAIIKYIAEIEGNLSSEVRVHFDSRDELTPGFKFNEWEVKGVPLRLEVGPRDLKNKAAVLVRRDTGLKIEVKYGQIPKKVESLLAEIQENLLKQALDFQKKNTWKFDNFNDFKKHFRNKGGLIKSCWCGEQNCEEKIQAQTKATIRVLLEKKPVNKKCLLCGKKAQFAVVFAKAY